MTRRGSECGGGAWTSAAAGTRRDGSALPKVTAAGTRCRGSGPRSYLVYRTRKSRLQIQVVCRIGTGFYILRCFIWMLTPSSHLKAVAGGVEKHTLLPFLQLHILYLPLRCAPQHWPLGSLALPSAPLHAPGRWAGPPSVSRLAPACRFAPTSGPLPLTPLAGPPRRAITAEASRHASHGAAASRRHCGSSRRAALAVIPSRALKMSPPLGTGGAGSTISVPPKRSRGPPGSRNRPGAIE